MEKKLTPLMRQYWDVKSEHQDKILFFRMGDFFEMFHKDAEIAAPILNIALTCRNKKSGDETKMCGMPHHSIAAAIGKLLAVGHKVAICDQVEDPKLAKGLVKRAVTRILSPGMVYDPETLNELQANYICSFDESSIAFYDSSTHEAFYYKLTGGLRVSTLLSILKPVEVILSSELKSKYFGRLDSEFHITAKEIDESIEKKGQVNSVLRLLSYVKYMSAGVEKNIHFELRNLNSHLKLPATTYKHLEVFKTYSGADKGSLFMAINRCKTSSGSRQLKKWLSFPLADEAKINVRLLEVEFWTKKLVQLKQVRKVLGQVGDVQRRLSKLASSNSGPRDLLNLVHSIKFGLAALKLEVRDQDFSQQDELMQALIAKANRLLVEEPPINLSKGGVVRKGFSPELDELIEVTEKGQQMLAELEASERSQTGISNLKIKYNNVFGYFLEVTHAHKSKVPERYTRKQTLTNAERYITPELKLLEEKILTGKTKRIELEQKLFLDLKNEFLDNEQEVLYLSYLWSELDIYAGLAWLAVEQNYIKPEFVSSKSLTLSGSRHPVIEQEQTEVFIANDIYLNESDCLLLTGPNMAGKSTIMRQVAVTSLMAQIGSFVPAKKALLPLYKQIFTRIGASDSLTEGLSTFMVEMKETSEIIQNACNDSLIIMDEVGRGTSTYDGMSLAQALLEHLVANKESSPHCLFATHYHELTQLSERFDQVKNVHMSIQDQAGKLNFLYKLVPGAANKSYGIQVAKLAGLPAGVIRRASQLLKSFEGGSLKTTAPQLPLFDFQTEVMEESQDPQLNQLKEEISKISLSEVTPLQALNKIAEWQQNLS